MYPYLVLKDNLRRVVYLGLAFDTGGLSRASCPAAIKYRRYGLGCFLSPADKGQHSMHCVASGPLDHESRNDAWATRTG